MTPANSFHAPVEEMIHGVRVTDPYRWLEDRELPETAEWLAAQQLILDDYIASCGCFEKVRTRVRQYLEVEVIDQPVRVGQRLFYRRREARAEQGSIYVRNESDENEHLLVDPSSRGKFASVGIHQISRDGSLLAYEAKYGGGDSTSIHVIHVSSGSSLGEVLRPGYSRGFVFASDLRGFYYSHEFPGSSYEHRILFHSFERPDVDRVCFERPRRKESRLILCADDVHLGALYVRATDAEVIADFWIASRNTPDTWSCICEAWPTPFSPILRNGRLFVVHYGSESVAQVVELALDGSFLNVVIPAKQTTIHQLITAGSTFFVNYRDNMRYVVECWGLDGKYVGTLHTPANGTVQLLGGQSDRSVFIGVESFEQSPAILEYGIDSGELQLWNRRTAPLPMGIDDVERTSFSSNDGVSIPITIIRRETGIPSKPAPCIMTSYGGFGISSTPRFSVLVSIMLELGCVFALPHIRGGGEFGKTWHDAARRRNRQVAFNDFIRAAEWLCATGRTTIEQLGMFGASNAGLLIGAALVQRPHLFRAALCIAPILDMIRYEAFDSASKWVDEYGTVEDVLDFHALHAYSPYHGVKTEIDYPATFFVSGDMDDRCNPAHARKMVARLQDRDAQRSPVILDHSFERGHSPTLPLSVRIEGLARRIAFLCTELNIPIEFGDNDDTLCA